MVDVQTPGTSPAERHRSSGAGLSAGLFLIGLGLILFLGQFRMFDWYPLGRLWPALLILLGAVRLASGRGNHRWGGFWTLLAGIYCAIGEWHLFGLSWHTAWPIFIIGAGFSVMLRGGREDRSGRSERYRRWERYGPPGSPDVR
jgi:hypothetical protein